MFGLCFHWKEETVKILCIEDHRMLSEQLQRGLLGYPEISVVDLIDTVTEETVLIERVAESDYDVILLDINLSKMTRSDGLVLCAAMMKRNPKLRIMIVTGYDYPAFEQEAQRAGARAFVTKDVGTQELYGKILSVANGEVLFRAPERDAVSLTEQELRIVALYASGLNREEVAAECYISMRTLANHLHEIYEKLSVRNYQEMVMEATKLGYCKETLLK